MDLSAWVLAEVASKLVIYFGIAAAGGGAAIASIIIGAGSEAAADDLRRAIARYSRLLIAVAMVAVVVNFFMQVGAFAEAGIAGLWDQDMLAILWQSAVGDASALRIIGFAILLVAFYRFGDSSWSGGYWPKMAGSLLLVGLVILVFSFRFVGHSTELSMLLQGLLGLHVLIAAWWMGSLWPLYLACLHLPAQALYRLMHGFGRIASVLVSLLIFAGGWLAYQLLGSWEGLFFSAYGLSLLLKIALVSGILLLAAQHKLRLVPALLSAGGLQARAALSRSIKVEMFVGAVILLLTAVLSTVMGPVH